MNIAQSNAAIVDILRSLGCQKGDLIMVHSDTEILTDFLPGAGILERCQMLEGSLREAVGEDGTILVPTFTYSFCNGRAYDPVKRNSEVGFFTNYFRRRPDAKRSLHPVFSFSAIGKDAESITADVPETGFGKGSVFDRFHKCNGHLIFIGASFSACTFVHHVEEMYGVDYRYFKTFRGACIVGSESRIVEAVNLVRDLDRRVQNDFASFAKHLRENELIVAAPTASGEIQACRSTDVFNAGFELLEKFPYIFLAHPPRMPPLGNTAQ